MRFKKTWVGFSLAAMLSSMVFVFGPVPAEAKTSADFTDLKDLDAATKAKFDALISAGIFDGVSDSTFGLKDEMNRAQFAKVAALIFNLEVDKSATASSFSDVKADDAANGYALPYIEALKSAGITDGYGEGTYNPAGKVTKEQLAAFTLRGLGQDETAKSTPGVTDNTVSDWAKGYVALALELKLLPNNADGTFGGTSNATRDLLVTGAYEAKEQYTPPAPKPSATPTPTPTVTPTPTPTATPTPTGDSTPVEQPVSTPTATPTPTPAASVSPITDYKLEAGTQSGSVAIAVYGQAQGSSLKIATGTSPVAAPAGGSTVSDVAGLLADYTSGNDIPDIGQYPFYIGVYEITGSGVIARFVNIELSQPDDLILTSYGLVAGSSADSFALYLSTPPSGAVDWKVRTSGQFIMAPPLGSVFGGQAVISGEEFVLSSDVQYIGLAAVDGDGKVVAFRCVPLSLANSGGSGGSGGGTPGPGDFPTIPIPPPTVPVIPGDDPYP